MRIVFLDAATTDFGDIDLSGFNALGQFISYPYTSRDEYKERVKDADILIVNKFVVDREVITNAPKLKYIVVAATGYNNIDLKSLEGMEINVSNVKGYSTPGVAQHVFALLLSHLNRPEYYINEVSNGRWSKITDFCFYDHSIEELAGKTLGIIGFGDIGKHVAKIAHAFGMKVITASSYDIPTEFSYVENMNQNTLMQQADIISLHCPLNENTKHIINSSTLALMKPNAILINTGRGQLINEEELCIHLKEFNSFTALIDVLSLEPPTENNPLLGIPNCKITPHIAWASKQSRQRLIYRIIENIASFKMGMILNKVY